MRFVCDAAGGKAWFRIEAEAEAAKESELMRHAVEKHFRRAYEQASHLAANILLECSAWCAAVTGVDRSS